MYIQTPLWIQKSPVCDLSLLQDVSVTVEKNIGKIEEEENVAFSKALHILC